MNTPTGAQTNRRVFLSRTLTRTSASPARPRSDLAAALGATQSNLSVVIADYSATSFLQATRSGEGISNTATRTCWGDTGNNALTGDPGPDCNVGDTCTASVREIDTACYLEVSKPTTSVTQWRVTRGIRDSSNRDSLWYLDATPVTIGQQYHYKFPTMPTEHIFKAGHQIGIIIGGTELEHGVGHRQRQRRRHARHPHVQGRRCRSRAATPRSPRRRAPTPTRSRRCSTTTGRRTCWSRPPTRAARP